jgi:beta-fructofuranosidase
VAGLHWYGQMILPRELSVHSGRLYQQPVRELQAYRKDAFAYQNIPVSEKTELPGIRGRAMDITLGIRPGSDGYETFEIRLAAGEEVYTSVLYDRARKTITVDRSRSGVSTAVAHVKTFHAVEHDNEMKLRLILDRCSMELFVNDGEQTFSLTLNTDRQADGISFRAEGNAVMDISAFTLGLPE